MKTKISFRCSKEMAIALERAVRRGKYSSKSEFIKELLIKRIKAEKE